MYVPYSTCLKTNLSPLINTFGRSKDDEFLQENRAMVTIDPRSGKYRSQLRLVLGTYFGSKVETSVASARKSMKMRIPPPRLSLNQPSLWQSSTLKELALSELPHLSAVDSIVVCFRTF
jgi:hypothetical protein